MNRTEIPAELMDDVKNYLNITWSDAGTDANVRGYIASGMVYLNKKYGAEADYTADGMPRTLLMEYARYMRDSALDVFENNYREMLLGMQTERLVNEYAMGSTVPPTE